MVLTPLWGIGGQDIDFLGVAQKISLSSLSSLNSLMARDGLPRKIPPQNGSGIFL
jgi:hypothetical protein